MLTSLQHPRVKHWVKLREKKSYRNEESSVLVSGVKLVKELLEHVQPRTLIVDPSKCSMSDAVEVSTSVMKKITGLQEPDGLAAEFPMPALSDLQACRRLLVLDRINDPGNLGTLLRTALALGWEGVFLTEGSVDPFNEKVLRAAKGAQFRLPLCLGSPQKLLEILNSQDYQIFQADMEGNSINKIIRREWCALLLSNEAHGLDESLELRGEKVSVPMDGEMESLNVAIAGAILMYGLNLGACDGIE